MALMFASVLVFAATQANTTHHTNVSITADGNVEAPTNTLGGGDAYIEDDLEVDGDVTIAGTLNVDGAMTPVGLITPTAGITMPSGSTLTLAAGSVFNSTWAYTTNTGAAGLTATYGLAGGSLTVTNQALIGGTLGVTGAITASQTITETYGIATATVVASAAITAEQLTSTDDATITDELTTYRLVVSSGRVNYTDASGNGKTQQDIIISTAIAVNQEYSLQYVTDGKAGAFEVIAGTYTAHGSFATDGTVTLGTGQYSPSVSTTKDNVDTLNIYDGGTYICIENLGKAALQTFIRLMVTQ